MPGIDEYIAALRQRLGNRLSADAERELRMHYQDAFAAGLADGLAREQADAVALERLGKVEDVARAFDREPFPLRHRLAGGPIVAILADVRGFWRPALLATALAALVGALSGQLLAPTYVATVRVGLVSDHQDYGLGLSVNKAVEELQSQWRIPVSSEIQDQQWAVVEARASERDLAVRQARQESQLAVQAFPTAFQGTTFSNGDRSVRLEPLGEPEVRVDHPTVPAAAIGALLGLIGSSSVALRRRLTRG